MARYLRKLEKLLLKRLRRSRIKAVILYLHETNGGIRVSELNVNPNSPGGTAKLVALDAAGNPTTFDDVPVWTNSDDTVLTLTPSADGTEATWALTGTSGSSVITVDTTESNTGQQFQGTGTITVAAADIASVSLDLAENAA